MKKRKDPNTYPPCWDAAMAKAVIDHYDNQTEAEAIAEDEAAFRRRTTLVVVPTELVDDFAAQIDAFQSRNLAPAKKKTPRRKAG
jgi:hypothetical protein